MADTIAPLLQRTLPADNATAVSVTANLGLEFSEAMKVGSGLIKIYKSDGTLFLSIAANDASQVTLDATGTRVIINPSASLLAGTSFYVLIEAGAFEDLAGNDYAGLSAPTAFNFTTAGSAGGASPPTDTAAPLLTGTTPADNAANVAVSANLVLTFNEAVKAGSGNIEIRNAANGSLVQSIAVTDASKATFSGNQLTINPGSDLSPGANYYVTFASGVVLDLANNAHTGIASQTTFNFSTAGGYVDTTTPLLLFKSPNTTNIFGSASQNIVLTFNEPVKAGTGVIEIRYTLDGSLYRTIPVTDTSQVIFSGRQVTIDPATDLASDRSYTVVFPPGVIDDATGHDFSGTTVNLSTFVAGGGVFATAIGVINLGDLIAGNDMSLDITLMSFQAAMNGSLVSVTPTRVDILGTDGLTYRFFGSEFNTAATTIPAAGGYSISLVEVWAGTGNSAHIVYSYYTYENTLASFGTFDVSYNLSGSDTFIGSSVDDVLFGYGGGDTITGREGNDVINGGTGDDSIAGGLGADSLAGAAGYDTLKYTSLVELNGDTVNGFEGGDKIDLSAIAGLTFIGTNPFSGVAGQVRYLSSGGNTILQVDSDGNGAADVSLTFIGGQFQLGETQTGSRIIAITSESVAPTFVSAYPSDNATNVDADTPFYLTFSENVAAGTGSFEIRRIADDSLFDSLAVTDSRVHFQGNVVSFSPHVPLESSTGYYIKFAPGVVKDLFGNSNTGISSSSTLNFTSEFVPDTTAPTLVATTPADDASNVGVGTNITLTFSEAITAGNGSVWIYEQNGALFRAVSMTDASQVSISGNTATINPDVNLFAGKSYFVLVGSDAVRDGSGNTFAGFSDSTRLNFTTAGTGDFIPPQLIAANPALGATNVSVGANIVLTFSETVQAGQGIIYIHGPSYLARAIDVQDASQVSFSGNTVTINPTSDLDPGATYVVTFSRLGTILDSGGNGFGGVGTPDVYFTTKAGIDASPPVVTTTWPADNATGVETGTGISILFSEVVKAGAGNIEIRQSSNGALVESIPITDTTRANIYSAGLYVDPATTLQPGVAYYIVLPPGVVTDWANNSFGGITSPTTLNFTTLPDTSPPALISTTPANGSSGITVGANIILTFNEAVVAGQGTFEVHRASDGGIVASPSATDASQVTFSGNTITLNPSGDLAPGEWFYVTFSSGVVKDIQGNVFGGVTSPATLSFRTAVGSEVPSGGGSLTGNGLSNTIVGTSGDDVITGLGRGDKLTGAGGSDKFVYTVVADSTSKAYDTVTDYNASADLFDLWFPITGVDSAIASGSLGTRRFDSDLASAVNAAKLAAYHAVLFTPNAGTLSGNTFLIVDANGQAGYQASADLVILLGNASSLTGLTAADFV